ncbi:MAG: Ig-like domain-containing protein [Rhodobiaceae bacterium]|nr:Ig-like domain-containing protein [Rhodobiaceae bacterium]
MKKFMFALALILGVTGIAGSALAESYDVDVKANAQNHIGWRAIYALIGCELRPPDTYSVGRQPQHGKVTLTIRQVTSNDRENGCTQFKGKAVAVTYTPDKGYRGPDSFTVRITYQRYSSPAPFGDVVRYNVNVK